MKVLVPVSVLQRLHVREPKVIRERADEADSLLESVLDLEAQTVGANDVDGTQRDVRGHQEDGTARRMNDHDETHELTR